MKLFERIESTSSFFNHTIKNTIMDELYILQEQITLTNVLLEIFSKINKRPGPNKNVLGGSLPKFNKNVLDYN